MSCRLHSRAEVRDFHLEHSVIESVLDTLLADVTDSET